MNFSQIEVHPARRFGGLGIVVLLHVLVAYALITGLARKVIDVIKQPIETTIIEEIKPPPDKPPPPPPPKVAPPPSYIPPPEVQIAQPLTQNVITDTTAVKPDSAVLASVGPVAPPAPPVRVPPLIDAKACDEPPYPPLALRSEEEGVVTLALLIDVDGRVIDSNVEKSSGFKELDKAAKAGLSLCKFRPGTLDGKPVQAWGKIQYVWKLPGR